MALWQVPPTRPKSSQPFRCARQADLAPSCPHAESKSDFTSTLVPNLVGATHLPLAVVEYRLAPLHPHPSQIVDVLSALAILSSPALLTAESGSLKWSRRSLYLVGHSAGAFMAATTLLAPPALTAPLLPEFAVPPHVRSALAGIACSDGIYDLPSLLDEYPDYAGFVADAFGSDPERLTRESPARWRLADRCGPVRVLVVHSREDELLTLRQPDKFVARIEALLKDAGPEWGSIEVDYDSLRGKHDEVPVGHELPAAVAKWVNKVEAAR